MNQERKLRVLYPSGNVVEVDGVWKGVMMAEGTLCPTAELTRSQRLNGQMMTRGGLFVADPRAVVLDSRTGEVLYQPRGPMYAGLSATWKELLDEIPDWPPVEYRGS